MASERIGFIGLGIMGNPMAQNLLKGGFAVIGYDLNPASVQALAAAGGKAAASAAEVVKNCDIVITMLPDSPDVEGLVLGPQGISNHLKPGMLFIDMSTIAPATSRKIYEALHAQGVEALDAPVSGGEVGAKAATLSIMVGGNEAAFNRAKPIFEKLGKSVNLIGPAGAGQVTKMCNQIVVGVNIQAVAEALLMARKAGVDVAKVREALMGGFAGSKVLEVHGKRILDGNFEPGFKLKLHRKDLNIALQTARELKAPLPATALVASQMDACMGQGKAEKDHVIIAQLLSQMAGL